MSANENIKTPADRRYSAEHVWAMPDGGVFIAGISDFAQDQLNDVMFVDLPEPGKRFAAGESFGSVESVKSVNELYMPLAGTISAVNQALFDNPALVNESPYADGWMVRFKAEKTDEFSSLLTAEDYWKNL